MRQAPTFGDLVRSFWRWRAGVHLERVTDCLIRAGGPAECAPLIEELARLIISDIDADRRHFGLFPRETLGPSP